MKKITTLLIIAMIAVNAVVFAEANPKIAVSSEEANPGETVDIEISLENNPGIISMLLSIKYDETVMKLKGVKDEKNLGDALHGDDLSANPYSLFWSNGTAKSDFKNNGKIATLTYEILEDAKAGTYPITISYDKNNDGIFNFNFENVDFDTEDGKITVKEQKSEGTTDKGVNLNENDKKADATAERVDNQTAEPNEICVTINGNKVEFIDQLPIIIDDRTLVPMRAIFEALGATVDWNDDTKTVLSQKDEVTISLTIGSCKLFVNGEEKIIDVPAQIVNDRTMVPIRAIAESFNCDVKWDEVAKTVIISK